MMDGEENFARRRTDNGLGAAAITHVSGLARVIVRGRSASDFRIRLGYLMGRPKSKLDDGNGLRYH